MPATMCWKRPRQMPLHLAILILLLLAGTACRKKRTSIPKPPPVAPPRVETGVASWYGHPYHGRRTANGEVYDMKKMTAAHRTRPFNSWVRVHNLDNGRTVDVRINDRGPFTKGRIIDLSRAAARRIRMIGPGTARVRIETIAPPASALSPPVQSNELSPADAGEHGCYTVQVGAFANFENADRLQMEIDGKLPAARIVERDGEPPMWRVVFGEFPERAAAEREAEEVRAHYPSAFPVRLAAPCSPAAAEPEPSGGTARSAQP